MPEVIVKDESRIPDADRVTRDRPDFTVQTVDVDVTVAAERLAAVIRSSVETILAGAANAYNSGWMETGEFNKLIGFLQADADCTIYLEESLDGVATDPDTQTTQVYTANATDGRFSFEIVAPYVRFRVVAAASTTTFRVWSRLSTGA